jgi:hypothetical protein
MAIMALVFAYSAGGTHRGSHVSNLSPSNLPTFMNRRTPSSSHTLTHVSPMPSPATPTTIVTDPRSSGTGRASEAPTRPSQAVISESMRSYPGYLSYPDNIVTSYPFDSVSGQITATASWTAEATIEVSVDCAASQRWASGTSMASVSISAAAAPCTVQLTEETDASEPIAYNLTVTIIPSS